MCSSDLTGRSENGLCVFLVADFTLFRSLVCPRFVSAVKSLMVNIFFTVLVIMKDHLKLHMKLYVEF